jgi:hypothetical protein
MSKRRRDRQPNLPPEAYNAPAAIPQLQTEKAGTDYVQVAPAKRGAASVAAPATGVNWQGEYGEVLGDLRRTFIIFTALVLAMIALSFVIR